MEKELGRVFTPLKSRATSKKSGRVNRAVIYKGDSFLKVVTVRVFGTDARALLDTETVTNFMSVERAKNLKLAPRPTQKTITVADGYNYGRIGRF